MNIAFSVFRLQNLDTHINQIRTRINEIEKVLSQDAEVQQALAKLEQSEQAVKARRQELNQIVDQVEAKQLKLKLTQTQLFGGRIKNPKELQDLQQESEALKRYIAKLEDDQLLCMIAHEEAQEAQKQADLAYKQALGDKASQNANLLGEKTRWENELPGLLSQRDAILSSLDAKTLALYQGLLKTKNGRAVAEVIDGCCDTCGATLTPGELQSARSPSSILRCRTCGRILFKS